MERWRDGQQLKAKTDLQQFNPQHAGWQGRAVYNLP